MATMRCAGKMGIMGGKSLDHPVTHLRAIFGRNLYYYGNSWRTPVGSGTPLEDRPVRVAVRICPYPSPMQATKRSNDFTEVKSLADYHICDRDYSLLGLLGQGPTTAVTGFAMAWEQWRQPEKVPVSQFLGLTDATLSVILSDN
jgi:hypothetical protein